MLWCVWNLLVLVLAFPFFFWSQYQSGSSFGYLSNRIGVSYHFCFYVIPRWLIINLEEAIRTAAISTVVNGNFGNIYPNGPGGDSMPNNLNSPQMIYSIPEVDKTYWVRANGYWVSVTRRRQESVWILILFFQCASHATDREMMCYSGMYSGSKMEYVLHLRWGGFYHLYNWLI